MERLRRDDREGVFDTNQKTLMFAAAVGWATARDEVDLTEQVPSKTGDSIRLDIFRTADDLPFLDALAVDREDDLKVMSDERQPDRITLFEQYAAAGLAKMRHYCIEDNPDSLLDGLIRLMTDLDREAGGDLPGLDGVF
ncbi:DNA phosphorothioation-associated protein 4 [Alienimonas californiensis]